MNVFKIRCTDGSVFYRPKFVAENSQYELCNLMCNYQKTFVQAVNNLRQLPASGLVQCFDDPTLLNIL